MLATFRELKEYLTLKSKQNSSADLQAASWQPLQYGQVSPLLWLPGVASCFRDL